MPDFDSLPPGTFCWPELATTANVGQNVNTTSLQPGRADRGAVTGQHRNFETSVAVKQRRIRPVQLNALLMNDEHRHARAVFTRIKHLLSFVIGGLESGDLNRAIQ